DLMSGFFALAALWLLLTWKEDRLRYAGALACYIAAAYSYESAAPVVVFVLIIFYKYHGLALRRSVALSAPFFLGLVVYAAQRHWVMGRSSQSAPLSGGYWQTLIDMIPVAAKYARLAWGIPPFCADYCDLLRTAGHSLFSWPVIGGSI